MEHFLAGASTAAHQVEGNNIHSDYWAMEQMAHTEFNEPSGAGVDHYHRYEEDIRLLAQAGLNAYRFSIEWARIEPEKGVIDEEALAHYAAVLDCCRANGVEPVVTLHHFTSPRWVIAEGGWESEKVVGFFEHYTRIVMEHLGDRLHYICTVNEANMGIQVAAIARRYLKQMLSARKKKADVEGQVQVGMNFNAMLRSMKYRKAENEAVFGTKSPAVFVSARSKKSDGYVMAAHAAARAVIKAYNPNAQVGLTLSLHDIQAVNGGEKKALREWNDEFAHYLKTLREDDFIGVQNYSRSLIGPGGQLPNPEGARVTQMGYEFYPEALGNVIRRVWAELGKPILVTENGIASEDDEDRVEFIQMATAGVKKALGDGIPVLGYLHWSLLDNFEWQKGYGMRFGLISVNRETMERTVKPSLAVLGACLAELK